MEKAILELIKSNISSRNDLMLIKRKIAKKYSINILQNSDILKVYKKYVKKKLIEPNFLLEKILRKRSIRTMSGIAPVAVLVKPYSCPGKCVYCPTEKNVPQSYLSNEPAVMRAIRCGYNPYKQVQLRLRALEANGHNPEKIELIVIGGTWSVLPKKYKYWYIANLFAGANKYHSVILKTKHEEPQRIKDISVKTGSFATLRMTKVKEILNREQKRNEKAKYKIIGLTLETRPDYINEKEILEMRGLGCTRVELGVQAVDDKILKLNQRGHGVKEIVVATRLLKDYGFKVTYHIMPGLPGSTAVKDFKMFEKIFADERFQPDQIKFYPTIVTKSSLLYKWWRAGKYKPYSDKGLQNLIKKCKNIVPAYVRIIRLIRDIPGESIMAGNMITNLRQVMQDRGVNCQCIRCREARERKFKVENLRLNIITYKASQGDEYFLEYTDKSKKILYGFCRLRLTKSSNVLLGADMALIRELHVYGELVPVGKSKKVQHSGLGKKLMAQAELIACQRGYKKIAVISGIGVRNYYRKLGYRLKNSYMFKNL